MEKSSQRGTVSMDSAESVFIRFCNTAPSNLFKCASPEMWPDPALSTCIVDILQYLEGPACKVAGTVLESVM